MPLSCEEYYRTLHGACGQVLAQSFQADVNGQHAASHHFLQDLEVWRIVLSNRPETVLLSAASSEYHFALLAVTLGQYRQAFMSLRLSAELLVGMVYYSANELQFRLWMNGERDMVWASLIDSESGVFSKLFVGAFSTNLAHLARQYGTITEKVYRECSEFVHGNAQTHLMIGETFAYQEDQFLMWQEKAKSVRLVTSFALCARYAWLLEPEPLTKLETVLLDNLGHLKEVRALLGAPVENLNV